MIGIRSYGPSLVLAAMTAAVLLGGPSVMRQLAWAEKDAQVQKSRQKLEQSPLDAINEAFGNVAESVEPSVVHISISRKSEGVSERMLPQLPEDLLVGTAQPEQPPQPEEPPLAGRGGALRRP